MGSVPDTWGVSGQKPDKVMLGALGSDPLEFLIDTLHWKIIGNAANGLGGMKFQGELHFYW